MFADNTLWQREGDNHIIPVPTDLSQELNPKLCEEYRRQTYENVKYIPISYKRWGCWQCTCGALNRVDEPVCHSCGDKLSILEDAYDIQKLQSSIAERDRIEKEKAEKEKERKAAEARRLREEEQRAATERARRAAEATARAEQQKKERIEQKKKTRKTALIGCAAVAVIALLVYLIGWQLIPSAKYKKAEEALSAGNVDEASQIFDALGTYGDSKERAAGIRYEEAQKAFDKGDYEEAYRLFSSIGSYQDAMTKAKTAKYNYASSLLEQGNLIAAAEAFEQIKGFKDANDKAAYCRNEQGYHDATALFDKGEYKDAAAKFSEISDYRDSAELRVKAYYLYAKEQMSAEEYLSAYNVLSSYVNADGQSYEDSIELANDAGYQYATKCFEEKNYEEAAKYFAEIEGYKDSSIQVKESRYQYALALLNNGKFFEAEPILAQLGNYKDSVKQHNESRYQIAINYREKGKYEEALVIFEDLKNYSDSANQVKETKYAYADSLLKKRELVDAVEAFKELGNFSDSKDKWQYAMYSYVHANKNANNTTTYEYLKELKKLKYKDSAAIYDNLYAWKVTIYINDDEEDYKTKQPSIGKDKEICCHIWLSGGPPNEEVAIKAIAYWPYGGTNTVTWDQKWTRGDAGTACYWYNNPARGTAGTFTVRVYIGSEMIGSESIRITE